MRVLSVHNRPVSSVTFSADGTRLAIGGTGGVVKVFDIAAEKQLFHANIDGMFPNQIHTLFSKDGARLFATNQWVYALSIDGGAAKKYGDVSTAYFRLALSSPDGGELWAVGDGSVARICTSTWESLKSPAIPSPDAPGMITWPGVATSQCGIQVALSRKAWAHSKNRDGVFVCDAKSGHVRFNVEWQGHEAKHLSFHPNGTLLAGACGPILRVWDLTAGAEIAAIRHGKLHFMGAAFSHCGRYLAAVNNDRTTRFWTANVWNEPRTFDWNIGKLQSLAFSPDGMTVAVASDKGKVLLFDVD